MIDFFKSLKLFGLLVLFVLIGIGMAHGLLFSIELLNGSILEVVLACPSLVAIPTFGLWILIKIAKLISKIFNS